LKSKYKGVIKTMRAIIITGDARYEKDLPMHYWVVPIWKIGFETANQRNSEEYLLNKGFKKIEK
jgi:hypothetical protein